MIVWFELEQTFGHAKCDWPGCTNVPITIGIAGYMCGSHERKEEMEEEMEEEMQIAILEERQEGKFIV